MKDKTSILYVLLAGVLWGTTGTTQTFAPEGAVPVTVGAIRMVVGGITLLLFVGLQGNLDMKNLCKKSTVMAAFSVSIFQPLFFTAVSITGVAVGSVVAIGSAPILAGTLEWMVWRKMPDKKWWLSTILAIIGCILLFFNNPEELSLNFIGIILALGAGLGFAIYILVSKRLLETHTPETVVAVVFTLSGLFLAPLLFIYDTSWLFHPQGVGVALHLGVVATAAAYLFFVRGLKGVSASTAVTLTLVEPLTAAMLGVFIVGEKLNLFSWFGIVLLFIGLVILSYTVDNEVVVEGHLE